VEFNLADLFEHAADAFADREYVVAEGKRRTYGELEGRANRLAHHLDAQGVGPGDHVGIYAYNCVEWVEAVWAVFKIRAVWININYRYVEDELRYIFDNAGLKALIHQRVFSPRIAAVRDGLPTLKHTLIVEDSSETDTTNLDSVDYEEALAAASAARDFGPRSPDDRYILYTGGTTGLPKGVVWRQEDVFYALGGGIDPYTKERVTRPEQMVEKGQAGGITSLPIAPLMHGASQWAVMGGSFVGNKIVLVAKFDAHRVWDLVERERVNLIMITGDAMARPLIEALDDRARIHDTSTLMAISSSAAVFSPTVKDDFFRHFPALVITDAIGASESGMNGMVVVTPGHTAMKGGPTVNAQPDTVVLDDALVPIPTGNPQVGRLARRGNIPLGYLNDPVKTAETFATGPDGTRYSIPGDAAVYEPDGTITLLGRGSVSINSGGEKIFPEEVEAAVKSHPRVYDATVVGVADERWGQRVVAVVQFRQGTVPTLEELQDHCRTRIAGYKLPRELHPVDQIVRAPSGKPDYRWAKSVASGQRQQ
jgi:acyl-CoA synthetase (AMP-forming)/AMP-acid ligase II